MTYRNLHYIFPMLVWVSVPVRAESDAYLYQNCSGKNRGIPLVDCSSAEIDRGLKSVRINHFLEPVLPISSSRHIKYLESNTIPIAIPENYASVSSWDYKYRRYIKFKTDFDSGIFEDKVDVIVVLDEVDEELEKKEERVISLDDPKAKPLFSFWYSARRGVLAIGLPKAGDSGDVYYCVSKSCLFGP